MLNEKWQHAGEYTNGYEATNFMKVLNLLFNKNHTQKKENILKPSLRKKNIELHKQKLKEDIESYKKLEREFLENAKQEKERLQP